MESPHSIIVFGIFVQLFHDELTDFQAAIINGSPMKWRHPYRVTSLFYLLPPFWRGGRQSTSSTDDDDDFIS